MTSWGLSLHEIRSIATPTSEIMKFEGSEEAYFVETSNLVGVKDFISASATLTEGMVCLNVLLSGPAAEQMRDYTAHHVGDHLAVVIDGVLVEVTKIFAPLVGDGFLIGGLGEKRARELANRINGQHSK